MMRLKLTCHILLLAGILNTLEFSTSFAATATTRSGMTNVRAGPGKSYAVIRRVGGGSHVNVTGCLQDLSWCKGSVEGVDGWISATRLEGLYTQRTGDSPPIIDAPIRAGRNEPPPVTGRILGQVTDRPGYCYALDAAGNSVIVRC